MRKILFILITMIVMILNVIAVPITLDNRDEETVYISFLYQSNGTTYMTDFTEWEGGESLDRDYNLDNLYVSIRDGSGHYYTRGDRFAKRSSDNYRFPFQKVCLLEERTLGLDLYMEGDTAMMIFRRRAQYGYFTSNFPVPPWDCSKSNLVSMKGSEPVQATEEYLAYRETVEFRNGTYELDSKYYFDENDKFKKAVYKITGFEDDSALSEFGSNFYMEFIELTPTRRSRYSEDQKTHLHLFFNNLAMLLMAFDKGVFQAAFYHPEKIANETE